MRLRAPLLVTLVCALATAGSLSAGADTWSTSFPYGGLVVSGGLVVDPASPSELHAAPYWRGIYRSTDAAGSWTSITDDRSSPELTQFRSAIELLLIDPSGGGMYVVGMGSIYRSTNGGLNWAELVSGITGHVQPLAIDPLDGDTLYAGTQADGLYKTTDGGANWSAIGAATLPADEIRSLAVDPLDPLTLYLGTWASGVWESGDGGATWTATGAGPTTVDTLLVDPVDPQILYAADKDGTTGRGIYKSTDGGTSWSKLSPILEFPFEWGRVIAFDPTNSDILYGVTDGGIYKSLDAGLNWNFYAVTDRQVSTVAVDPATPSNVYAGTHPRGVFKSTDGGMTWAAATSGIRALAFPHAQHHSLAVDAWDASIVYAGTFNDGYRSLDGGASWSTLALPEDSTHSLATHPGAPGTVFAFGPCLYKSTDNGATWFDPAGGTVGCFSDGDLVIHSGDPNTIYIGGYGSSLNPDGVHRSTNGGATFTHVSVGLTNPEIHCLGVDPNDGNVLYAGTRAESGPGSSALYKSTDGAATWTQLGGGLPAEFNPNAIVVHPADSNVVYVGSETTNGGVYLSNDAGATWTKILDENVNSIAVNPGNTNQLYVGTWNTGGFYRTFDAGNHWTQINSGLPYYPGIDSVVVDPADANRILLGTTGGVYEYTFGGTATLTVTHPGDSGPGSLRDAMEQANQDGTPNEIRFDPSMAGQTIQLLSQLPSLNSGDTDLDGDIDGDCVPDIAIDGQWMPNANGININSNNNRVAGLAIHSFDCPGCGGDLIVTWNAHDNLIECNYLGTDLSGTANLGTQTFGVKVVDGSTGNQIGPGNLIVYNGTGILFETGSSNNTAGPGNTIAFSGNDAVRVTDGMDWAYPDFSGYTGDPIQVFPLIDFTDDGGLTAFHSADGITPVDSFGHTFHESFGARFTGTLVVGTAGTYTFDLQHDDDVRLLVDAGELFAGGCCGPSSVDSALAAGSHAIEIDFAEGGGHAQLQVVISGPGSATLNTDGNAGGCTTGQPGLCGELFQLRIPSDYNTITQNSTYENGNLAINLESGGGLGVTANDPGDVDIGPNTLLNFPEFTSVLDLGGGLYSVDGTAPPDSAVEIFAAAVDPSGHGEGKEYLDTLTADPTGVFSGSVTLPPGYFAITATATDLDGNTSEFSYRSVLSPNYLTVDSLSDSGPGSLRDAIEQSNADGVTTFIDFDPGLAGGTIQLFSDLPALTDPETTIDGDLDDDCLPDIALDGSSVGGTGLRIFSSSNLVQGLAIHSFGNEGVTIAPWASAPADDNVVECNFIGTDLSGTVAMPNGNAGLSVQNQATNNRIGGPVATSRNVISGNQWAGVYLGATAGNIVQGNYIGTDVSGVAPLGNQSEGIHLGGFSGANQIGPDNVISANGWVGIYLWSSSGSVVEGNFIGTDPSGTIDLGNQSDGINVDGDTFDNRFGPGNVIAFNGNSGVSMKDTLAPDWWDFTSYSPDYVDVFSVLDLSAPDECSGVVNSDGVHPVDGGGGEFVEFFSARFSGTLNVDASGDYTFEFQDLNNGINLTIDGSEIYGNCCGTNSTSYYLDPGDHSFEIAWYVYQGPGRLKLDITGPGNANLSTSGNLGGCPDGQTGLCGELFQRRAFALRNTITENSIFDNQNLGIDLQVCGGWGQVTPNDPGDGDAGPNTLLNFPEFTGFADLGGGSFTVDGTAPPDSRVELFAADPDPSGHGEGGIYLGFVTADPSGNFSAPVVLPAGTYAVTATATDSDGNTSEFSENLALRPNELTVDNTNDSGPGSLREALEEANFDRVETVITFDPGLAGQTIHLLEGLPSLGEGGSILDGDLDDDCLPDIELDGSLIGCCQGIDISSSNNTVRGLAVTNFGDGDGILINSWSGQEANNNVVECTYVGVRLDGLTAAGNRWSAVGLEGAVYDNRIGPGNRLAFNGRDGVTLWTGALNLYPDFQGVPPDPVQVFPVIDFVNDSGVFESADGIVPVDGGGNPFIDHFGARFTGTLNVDASGDYTFDLIGDDNARVVLDGEVILQTTELPQQVSVASGDHAIEIDYWQWGGYAALELQISGPGTPALNTDGNTAGCPTGQGGLCGEFFQLSRTPTGNRITQSSIHSHDNLGIDLGGDWITPNDPGDGDDGPNTLLNFPELTGSNDLGGGTYEVTGTAPPDSIVELFGSDEDPSGHGEGKEYLGNVVADPSGNFTTTVGLPADLFAVTATATDAAGNTSEFSQNLRVKTPDAATVGTAAIIQGATGEVPIYVRDLSATPLGIDQTAGSRIQGFTFQVEFSPPGSVAAITAEKGGITAGLAHLFETVSSSGNTITYLVSFDEGTNLIPFTLDGAAPGDQVAKLLVTVDPNAPPTPISLSFVAAGTLLTNQAGTLSETEAEGTLELFGGSVNVLTRSATALVAAAQSSSEVQLTWTDPEAGETGFRVEQSPDGSSWVPVATVGPDDTAYLDGGLDPATLYYFRVISFSGGGDNLPSNTASAHTFPASAAKTCVTQLTQDRTWARVPAVAWNGTNWATVYMERTDSTNDELIFRFLRPDGSPTGSAVRLTRNDMMSQYPSIYWNGTNFGVIWTQHMRGPLGEITSNNFFALLDANGKVLRNGVRLTEQPALGPINNDIKWSLAWDGGGWGFFQSEVFNEPWSDIGYWRLSEEGEVLLGPVQITNTPDLEYDVRAAWSGAEHGLAWIRQSGSDYEILFQRLLADGTQPVGDPGPVQLTQTSPGQQIWYVDVVWNGAGWAVTWMMWDPVTDHEAIFLRLVDGAGNPSGPVKRLSDDFDTNLPPEWEFPVYDEVPELFAKPGGGYVVFTSSYVFASDFSFQGWEIARLEADVNGDRVGQRRVISDFDGNHSLLQRAATNGSNHLVVFNENRQGTMETASALVGPSGNVVQGPHDLTCCHSPGNPSFFLTAGNAAAVPFQGGFVTLWTDPVPSGSWQLYGRIFDAGGAPSTSLSPLSGRGIRGPAGAAAVGDSFAVAWKDSNTLVFDRYDAAGNSLLGEPELAHDAGGPGGVALAYSGEVYGVAYYNGNEITLQRVDASGAPVGGPIAVSDLRGGPIELEWVGSGWAMVWRSNSDSNLYYALVDPWGSLAVPATQLTTTGGLSNLYDLLWTGSRLGLTWPEDRGLDPPGREHYFTELNLDGSLAYPEVVVSNPHWGWRGGRLYWKSDRFHLVRNGGDGSMTGGDGMVEDEILPGGAVLPTTRRLANRGWPDALAFDGAALALGWGQMRELYFQTDACLDDASAPPCPDVSVSSDDQAVHLSWAPVDDPESGIWRYNVYRDGFMLAEQFASSTGFDDEGFRPGEVHDYEVLALNGAYLESASCPVLTWSLETGDANGDGALNVLDIFFLINYFFAGGPPPMGDADANGDGSLTIADIFYLINYFFGGGPPPAAAAAAAETLASEATARAATDGSLTMLGGLSERTPRTRTRPVGGKPRIVLRLGRRTARRGGTVTVPVFMKGLGGRHQLPIVEAMSLGVGFDARHVTSAVLQRAGAAARVRPLFEVSPATVDSASLLASFDQSLRLPRRGKWILIARLQVTVSDRARPGTRIPLRFDAATTLLSNRAGTQAITAADGPLILKNGWLRVAGTRPGAGLAARVDGDQ